MTREPPAGYGLQPSAQPRPKDTPGARRGDADAENHQVVRPGETVISIAARQKGKELLTESSIERPFIVEDKNA